MDIVVLNFLNGVSFGSILFILATGLSLIMGTMGIINLAHGALYMLGAYIGWSVAEQYGLNFGLALLAAGVVPALVGFAMERVFLRHLYRQPFEQVLLTWGFVLILTNSTQWIWGAKAKAPFTALFLSGSFPIVGWTYPTSRIAVIVVGLVLAASLWWLQEKTRAGAIVRAGMDDKEMTIGLGINLGRVSAAVFVLGAFLAGFAGIIGAGLTGAYIDSAFEVLLLALIVIIVGGMGSVQGALLGSMLIGIVDAFGKVLFPELALATMYLSMIVILLVRPYGLLGRKA